MIALRIFVLPMLCGSLLVAQSTTNTDEPVTAAERSTWFIESTIGPASLAGGFVSAGFGTLTSRPKEYDTHWDGFAQRYGMRLSGLAVSNAMEAGMGAIWGEDPRYFRKGADARFGNRVKHVVKWTFVAAYSDGRVRPAYARIAAISSSNFLSNTWREPSEADNTHAVERIGLGFLGRMAGNTWDEFWPDVKHRVFHRHDNRD